MIDNGVDAETVPVRLIGWKAYRGDKKHVGNTALYN